MASRQEIRLALRRSVTKGKVEPMFGVEEVTDLNDDLERFLLQERILARLEQQWPSVLVNRSDEDCGSGSSERFVPIDLPIGTDLASASSDTSKLVRDKFWEAQSQGLPVWNVTLPSARKGFFEGLADMIYSRSRWIARAAASPATTPKVTVRSTPANQQAKWTKGHFFSTQVVFGNTIRSQNVPAAIYCFWLSKDTPSALMPLYDIQADTDVFL
jgi:hypothetical protein